MGRKKNRNLLYIILGIILSILAVFMILVLIAQGRIDKAEKYKKDHNLMKLGDYSVNEVIDNYGQYTQRKITLEGMVVPISKEENSFYLVDVSEKDRILEDIYGYYKKDSNKYELNKDRAILIKFTNRIENEPEYGKDYSFGSRIAVRGAFTTYITNSVYYTYEMIADEYIEVLEKLAS